MGGLIRWSRCSFVGLARRVSKPHLVIRVRSSCRVLGFLYFYGCVYAVNDRGACIPESGTLRSHVQYLLVVRCMYAVGGVTCPLSFCVRMLYALLYTMYYCITRVGLPSSSVSRPVLLLLLSLLVGLTVGVSASHFECFASCHSDDLWIHVSLL